jgi:hypothetical protein
MARLIVTNDLGGFSSTARQTPVLFPISNTVVPCMTGRQFEEHTRLCLLLVYAEAVDLETKESVFDSQEVMRSIRFPPSVSCLFDAVLKPIHCSPSITDINLLAPELFFF